jgi:ferredoxin, 2Fe-2S
MVKFILIRRDESEQEIDVAVGGSVMEAVRDSGNDELVALCGGCCSCATCHVYLDTALLAKASPVSIDEGELLDSSEHRTELSRLSCQLRVDEWLEGGRVTIAPEE